MKAFVLTHIGFEDICASEISKLISASGISTSRGRVSFSCSSEQDLVDLCYHGRTFTKVVLLLSEFEVSGMPKVDILKNLESFIGKSAVVRCERSGEHDFTSFDVEQVMNRGLSQLYNVEINHKRPASIFFLLKLDGISAS